MWNQILCTKTHHPSFFFTATTQTRKEKGKARKEKKKEIHSEDLPLLSSESGKKATPKKVFHNPLSSKSNELKSKGISLFSMVGFLFFSTIKFLSLSPSLNSTIWVFFISLSSVPFQLSQVIFCPI